MTFDWCVANDDADVAPAEGERVALRDGQGKGRSLHPRLNGQARVSLVRDPVFWDFSLLQSVQAEQRFGRSSRSQLVAHAVLGRRKSDTGTEYVEERACFGTIVLLGAGPVSVDIADIGG